MVAPHARKIIAEVAAITDIDRIKSGLHPENITVLDEAFDRVYLQRIKSLSLSPEAVASNRDMKIVYTPIHGCGYRLVPQALREFGFTDVSRW